MVGVAKIDGVYGNQTKQLPLVVVQGNCSIFGRNWQREVKLDLSEMMKSDKQVNLIVAFVENLCEKYKEIFKLSVGCLKNFEVSIAVKPNAVPVYKKARPALYDLRAMVEAELERLEESGVIKPIAFSEWVSPIVSDFKQTLNPVTDMAHYPLPTPEDIFATLASGQSFSKLDLSHA